MEDINATVNIEPSWEAVANIAILAIEDGTPEGKRKGREIVRDMGVKLAKLRASQPNCPDHLKGSRPTS